MAHFMWKCIASHDTDMRSTLVHIGGAVRTCTGVHGKAHVLEMSYCMSATCKPWPPLGLTGDGC